MLNNSSGGTIKWKGILPQTAGGFQTELPHFGDEFCVAKDGGLESGTTSGDHNRDRKLGIDWTCGNKME